MLLMLAAELTDSMSNISDPVTEVEVVDHTSETLEPATEALEEHGESWPVPKMLVLPLTDRLLVGAKSRKKKLKILLWILICHHRITGKSGCEVEEVSTKIGDLR